MRKNRFLTFFFSLVPGCGHMYLGYMKRGVEYMAMFAASAYFAAIFVASAYSGGTEALGAIFLILLPIIWLYQMFDSMHAISRMRRLEMQYADDDGFFIPGVSNITNINVLNGLKRPKVLRTIALIIIIVGIYVLFMNVSDGVLNVMSQNANNSVRQQYRQIYNNIMRYVPSVIISIVLIFAGVKLLMGSKKNKNIKNDIDNMNGGE